jgi:hypothetical protein
MNKIVCFGDSWAAGAELAHRQHPFVYWVAHEFGVQYVNYGKEGSSLGLILHAMVSNIVNLSKDDIVIVVIPPDTRWYDQNDQQGFYSIQNWQRDDYFKFLNNKTLDWFIYHHALFVYTIQKLLNDIGCQYVMMHNYGQILDYKQYSLPIDFSKFLSAQSLTDLLSGHIIEWRGYPDHLPAEHRYDQDGPPPEVFSGVYFQGCKQHPNELGHKKIAEIILRKIRDHKQI